MDAYKLGGAGEMRRRINVVYFLSRGGRTDHPHRFRVNHLHRAGVRLRDVKRWLSEFRGKDMPEKFSWSYKRKYKDGYVWQDLMDDDPITPFADNEYVLKGCDVRGTPPPCSDAPKAASLGDDKELKENEGKNRKVVCDQKQQVEEVIQVAPYSGDSSPQTPPPIDQDSPGGEGESARRATPFRIVLPQHLQEDKQQQEAAKASEQAVVTRAVTRAVPAEAAGSRNHPVGRARRMRMAQVLHSILLCGKTDGDDVALSPVPRQGAGAGDDDMSRTPVCPGIDGCGFYMSRKVRVRRCDGGAKDKAKRDGNAHYKPASLPRCSQCGKEFKPQELHSHMQSCRGFRERMRSSTSARIRVDRNRTSTARPDHRTSAKAADCSPERPLTAFLLTEL